MEHIRIGIIGNIGVGKSTLSDAIANTHLKQKLLNIIADKKGDEDIHIFTEKFNPKVLDEFYKDPIKNAFMAQIEFFNGRLERQNKISACKGIVIEDRTLAEDYYIFGLAQKILGNMTEAEFLTYQRTYNLMTAEVTEPDLLVYLRASLPSLKERIKKRGRKSEAEIPDNYLQLLNELYEQYISRHTNAPVLIIDTDDYSFDLEKFQEYCVEKIVENIKKIDLRVNTPGISKWVTLHQTKATIKAIEAEAKLENYLQNNPRLITIAGNVGLGKSTLTAIMERSLKIKGLYENPEDNPLLGKFLGNKKKYCFDLQQHFLNIRKKMQIKGKDENQSYVIDRSLPEDLLVFCHQFKRDGYLTSNELDLLTADYLQASKEIPTEDLLIILTGDTELAWSRIQQRGREMEVDGGWSHSDIDALNHWYKSYSDDVYRFGFYDGQILKIDVEKLDFTNRIHVGYIFEEIYRIISN
ncbi:MAG: deoxynucleoside kinase [Candidatus Cloacimonadota bacterium]|nr:deoxynucleoside kinase [Candidatus Cloacimonadota bacterium]